MRRGALTRPAALGRRMGSIESLMAGKERAREPPAPLPRAPRVEQEYDTAVKGRDTAVPSMSPASAAQSPTPAPAQPPGSESPLTQQVDSVSSGADGGLVPTADADTATVARLPSNAPAGAAVQRFPNIPMEPRADEEEKEEAPSLPAAAPVGGPPASPPRAISREEFEQLLAEEAEVEEAAEAAAAQEDAEEDAEEATEQVQAHAEEDAEAAAHATVEATAAALEAEEVEENAEATTEEAAEAEATAEAEAGAEAPAPSVWEELKDNATGLAYFHNTQTGEVSWDLSPG